MRPWMPMYDGDGLIHRPPRNSRNEAVNAAAAPATDRRELAERRGAALRSFFPKLASWLEGTVQRARRKEIEDYLAQSRDVFELEERIRQLDRKSVFPYY